MAKAKSKAVKKDKGSNTSALHAIRNDPAYLKLKALGEPVYDKHISEAGAIALASVPDLTFPTSATEKEEILNMCGKDVKEKLYHYMTMHGISEGDLDVLCWDYYTFEALVLYRESEKSFWVWKIGIGNLSKLGYHWTDLFLPDPCFYLDSYEVMRL